ncbi:DUF4145 domain-containing protein [Variovorax paradoxus]|uniref:DUF4145 domain-containing protein n=1 Tax=Variovorax paradoxus TaxID=34073 RepID=UPI003D657EDF
MNKKLLQRFSELSAQADALAKTEQPISGSYGGKQATRVDNDLFVAWHVKVLNLLEKACGATSQHLKAFNHALEASGIGNGDRFKNCRSVFNAAEEDYEGGYLNGVEELVRAEVFDDELEQAEELFRNGYSAPAAVVAGVVLESSIRGLCAKHGISANKLERMNADLVKEGVYTVLVQKQVTAMAHVRNKAAHGESGQYTVKDVEELIRGVRDFASAHV